MTVDPSVTESARFAGITALAAAVLAWATIGCLLAATGGDLDLLLRPADALSLDDSARWLFVAAMLADTFGFYLPFFVLGPFLHAFLRPRFGLAIDMAALCLVAYVLLGIAGTSIQMAALPVLSNAYTGGDPAAGIGWLVVVIAAQDGLWPMEGPVMAFWGWVIGRSLHSSGVLYGRLLMAVGVVYGGYFAATVAAPATLAPVFQSLALALLPLWLLLAGIQLVRRGLDP